MKAEKTITLLLNRWSSGDKGALEDLVPLVYHHLDEVAKAYMRREREDHTLESESLVHEAFIRLVDANNGEWNDRKHFYSIAARIMRQVLVDHARRTQSAKRGGDVLKVTADPALLLAEDAETRIDVLALNAVLERLTEIDPERTRLVELRFFGGLSHPEIAEIMDVSVSTVERQWRFTRAWLIKALES